MAPPLPTVFAQGQGAVSADNLNTFIQTVLNYAQLRNFPALAGMVAYAQGAATADDGGQGFYYYVTTGNYTDNNSTVIVANGTVQGAWLQLSLGAIDNLVVAGTLTVDGASTFEGVASFASDIAMTGTGELGLASGTTGQRSGTPTLGMVRYNTTLGYFEGYGATGWAPLSGSASSGVFPGNISGLLPSSIAGTNTTASLTISTGQAADTTAASNLNLSVATAWSVTNGNAINGFQSGATLPNSSTIHFFVCSGSSGTGTFASLSLTPTLPAGYNTYYRRIFSLVTGSGGSPQPYVADEINGGGLCAYLTTPTTDINSAATTSANRTLYSMNVPTGIKVQWQGLISNLTSSATLLITSPDEADTAPSSLASYFYDIVNNGGVYISPANRRITITNTSGQIGLRTTSASVAAGYTMGWIDFRRT
jgi:hypothetical protein